MIALIIIAVLIALILSIRLGVDIGYNDEKLKIFVKASVFNFKIYPSERKEKKTENKSKEKTKKQNDKGIIEKLGFETEDWLELIGIIFKVLAKFNHSIVINIFKFHYAVTDADPYDAVMKYNTINTVAGSLIPFMESNFRIKNRDIFIDLDFNEHNLPTDIRLVLTIRVLQIIMLVVMALGSTVKIYVKRKIQAAKEGKKLNGKQQAQ